MLSKEKIKYYASLKQKKYRQQNKQFLIEGFHLVEECLNSSFVIECIIADENISDKKLNILKSGKTTVNKINSKLFKKLSDTEESQGVVAVVNFKEQDRDFENKSECLIVALDRITDPGNLGTIIRTSYWFNVDAILVGEGSADIYNSKVVRSTQGGLFHTNIIANVDLKEYFRKLNTNGFIINLFTLEANKSLKSYAKTDKSVLVFGNESDGINNELLMEFYEKLKIPGYSKCESLNVAVSNGIALNYVRNIS